MSTRDELIAEIDAFLLRAGWNDYEFGIRVMNDKAFLHRLRRGRSIRLDTIDKVRAFMRGWKPPLVARARRESRSAA
jgi:hypothetical protein